MQFQQVQNCIKSINVTWVLITVWHFIVVVDKNVKSRRNYGERIHIRLLCDFDDKVAYIIGYVTYK